MNTLQQNFVKVGREPMDAQAILAMVHIMWTNGALFGSVNGDARDKSRSLVNPQAWQGTLDYSVTGGNRYPAIMVEDLERPTAEPLFLIWEGDTVGWQVR